MRTTPDRTETGDTSETTELSSALEPAVIRCVIGLFASVAVLYDGVGLLACLDEGGLIGVGRGLSAIGLGWMCGWYFTVRFSPTSVFLRHSFFELAGHLVAMACAPLTWLALGLLDSVGASAGRASFTSMMFVTFAPVAAWFATQLSRDRAVHFVAGVGIGALSYVVFFGVPD